jgi:4-hydroxy-3-polyprenylbenzoate decarboxylase
VKIKKEFAGHAQKVMNAMWGAGQMMFNKILVVVDEETDIHNYASVAKAISKYCDPQQDIYLSQGPMDVLDHSCSKFAFGGKMCIDATVKFEEELRTMHPVITAGVMDVDSVVSKYPEIVAINSSLLASEISVVFISVKKSRKNHIKELNQQLFSMAEFSAVKVIVYVEHTVDANDIADCIWRFANNIDPKRDSHIVDAESENQISHIGFDGTRKTKEWDNFQREWPNIIAANKETIDAIDEKWSSLGIGKFVPSPSLKYQKQLYPGGAVVIE